MPAILTFLSGKIPKQLISPYPQFQPSSFKTVGGDRGDIRKEGHGTSCHFPANTIQYSNSFLASLRSDNIIGKNLNKKCSVINFGANKDVRWLDKARSYRKYDSNVTQFDWLLWCRLETVYWFAKYPLFSWTLAEVRYFFSNKKYPFT